MLLILAVAGFTPASALRSSASEICGWELFSTVYDAVPDLAINTYDRSVLPTSAYDDPIDYCTGNFNEPAKIAYDDTS